MHHLKKTNMTVVAVGLIFVAALARLLPHPANFAPIGALALYGGAEFAGLGGLGVALGAMFVSDIFLGFHGGMWHVYGAFVLIFIVGRMLRRNLSTPNVIGSSLVASAIFYLVTNAGVWAQGFFEPAARMYPLTAAGLMQSYVMGLPFLGGTVWGDLSYSVALFGLTALVQSKWKQVTVRRKLAIIRNYFKKGVTWLPR